MSRTGTALMVVGTAIALVVGVVIALGDLLLSPFGEQLAYRAVRRRGF